ncbi:MAG: hypothetical protein ACOYOT_04725 [Bacteroidales bacterium]
MAHLIEVTITGGAYLGPRNDTKITINADRIIKIEDVHSGQIGTSKIIMDDKSEYYVTEDRANLTRLINK